MYFRDFSVCSAHLPARICCGLLHLGIWQTTHIGSHLQPNSSDPTTDLKSQTNSTSSFDDVSAHSFSYLQVDIPVLHLCIALVTLGPHPL